MTSNAAEPEYAELGTTFRPVTVDSLSAAEQIAEQLRSAMIEGSLNPGDRLPPEPELAAGFGVSRPTVREAMKILRGQGVVETARGARGGHFVRHPKTLDIAESLGETYCLWFDIGDISVAEVDEAREVVERACVRLAALRRTEDDLEVMKRVLEAASDPELTLDEFLGLEVAFHRAIANAARNRLLNLPMQAIHIVRPRTNKLLKTHDRPKVLRQHQALAEAIESGDPDVAEQRLEQHIAHLAKQRAAAARAERKDIREISVSSLGDG
ncbi:MAG: FadR/GntR family transcriptional regulator [Acidimicrobiia bacterium]